MLFLCERLSSTEPTYILQYRMLFVKMFFNEKSFFIKNSLAPLKKTPGVFILSRGEGGVEYNRQNNSILIYQKQKK